MKKSAFLGIFLLLLLVSPVFAEGSMSSPSAMYPEKKMIRENVKDMVQAKREEAKTLYQTKREELKTKLTAIKDERKKTVAENLDARLANINKNRTDEMERALTRLQEYLTRLTTHAQIAKSEGKDTALLDTAIATVQTDIEAAQAAITTQAGKDYIANVTTDASLRTAFSTIITQLKTDLLTTHKTLETVRKDLLKAVQEWEKLKSTTPSASTSATIN